MFLLLHMSETLFLILWKSNRSATLENRVLRRIFEHASNNVINEWMNLCYEMFHNLYGTTNVNMVIELRRILSRVGGGGTRDE
jgi:hypothetical protein